MRAVGFVSSSIGKKVVMAVTGVALFGFVLAHMVGNLQAYLGPETFNGYAHKLRALPALLWGMRIGLLVAVALHIWSATALTLDNWKARPVAYRRRENRASTYASRTMRWSGVILALFVVYHLMHFTFGTRLVHPQFVEGDAYHNFVTGFQNPLVSLFYVVAMLALGLHMWHGVWSLLQTLGLSQPRYNHWRQGFATFITAVVILGNISFPVAVLSGIIDDDRGVTSAPPAAASSPVAAR